MRRILRIYVAIFRWELEGWMTRRNEEAVCQIIKWELKKIERKCDRRREVLTYMELQRIQLNQYIKTL